MSARVLFALECVAAIGFAVLLWAAVLERNV